MTPGQHVDDRLTFLRPFGYVEPRPVARPLGVSGLHIGNRRAAMQDPADVGFEAVLTVSTERFPLTTHHHPLRDGEGNDWTAFADAVDTARRLARRRGDVLVNCKAGVSRSTTMLATTVAAETGRSFRESLELVEDARTSALPHPALVELACRYLAATA